MKRILTALLALLVFVAFTLRGKPKKPRKLSDEDFAAMQARWVDSVFNSLSPEQRLGQLFMVAAYSNKDAKHVREIKDLIIKYNIGGLIWMQGGPVRQAKLTNYYQGIAKTPLLYAIDGEWGLVMRLDSTMRYPRQMTLGALQDDSLIYYMGRQVAKDCKRLGIHVNFAPVADVNNNPLNPVIGMRSFGENRNKVAEKAYMYMAGMQDEHVMANGKHFPGHGDTDSDSHKTLPAIGYSRRRLDSLELYPFKYLFDRGLGSVMVAHLNVPALDTAKSLPSSLSSKVVTDLLKREMGFKGLVFTDALNMKGVSKNTEPGVVEVQALMAGNDVLLFSGNVPKAIENIKKAISDGKISQLELDERCKKLLRAKYWCGLNVKQEVFAKNLNKDLNSKQSADLNDKIAEGVITVLKNENDFLPLKRTDTLKIVEVSFGLEDQNALYSALKDYSYVEHVGLNHEAKAEEITEAFTKINKADVLVLLVSKAAAKPENNYGIGEQTLRLIDSLSILKPSVLVVGTNPYLLNTINTSNFKAIVLSYEYMPSLLRASAHVLVGLADAKGRLPVSTRQFSLGTGIPLKAMPLKRQYEIRKDLLDKKFAAIDSIALNGIEEHAYPGCQIVAMKDGKVIYQKSFGNYTYNRDSKEVDNGTLYDLASLTKIASSSLALMKLQSEQKFDYHNTLGSYLPYLKGTNKENLVIEQVLSHQSGLQPWLPFYIKTLEKNDKYKPGIYAEKKSDDFPTTVAKDLFIVKGYTDTIYTKLVDSKLENVGKYVYSDLGYYFMQQIIEQQSGKKINDYVKDIYASVGIGLTYLPLNYLSRSQIAPTENDAKFRRQIVQGYVHDPGAALMGGVAGHAGLFGNALDVAKLMQLFLDKGELNGVRVLDSNVVRDYTSCHFCPRNRRGLCFEKPEPDTSKDSPVTGECSPESFGHAGFTGTFAWADPKNGLVYVFLSNRVFPNADENKLVKLGIRGKIHKAFYEALKEPF